MIDVRATIDSFCELVGWEDTVKTAGSFTPGFTVVPATYPQSKLLIGEAFKLMEDEEAWLEVKSALCLLMARLKFKNRNIAKGSSEWRYFALKGNVLKAISEAELNHLDVLVKSW